MENKSLQLPPLFRKVRCDDCSTEIPTKEHSAPHACTRKRACVWDRVMAQGAYIGRLASPSFLWHLPGRPGHLSITVPVSHRLVSALHGHLVAKYDSRLPRTSVILALLNGHHTLQSSGSSHSSTCPKCYKKLMSIFALQGDDLTLARPGFCLPLCQVTYNVIYGLLHYIRYCISVCYIQF